MAHPTMFDDDDRLLARVRQICLAMPDAAEKVSHGRPNFFTKKVFATYGGSVKGDHSSDEFAFAVLFLPDRDEHEALLNEPRYFVPAYVGAYGWLGHNLRSDRGWPKLDWTEVAELVDMSYRNTAPKRLVAELGPVVPSGGNSGGNSAGNDMSENE